MVIQFTVYAQRSITLYLVGFPEKMVIMPTNFQGSKPQCMLGWGSPWCTAICPLVYKHICTITPKNIAKMYKKNIAKMYACMHSLAKPTWRNTIMYVVPNYDQSVHIHTHTHKQNQDTTQSPYGMFHMAHPSMVRHIFRLLYMHDQVQMPV